MVKSCVKKVAKGVSISALMSSQMIADLGQEQCQCPLLHLKPSCRNYIDGKHCPYGESCSFEHDRPGQNIRRRKAAEHYQHHELLSSGRSFIDEKTDLRAVDGTSLKRLGSLIESLKPDGNKRRHS